MNTHANKTQEYKSQSVANTVSQKSGGKSTFQFVDNRPEAVAQKKLQESANKHLLQRRLNTTSPVVQLMKKSDITGALHDVRRESKIFPNEALEILKTKFEKVDLTKQDLIKILNQYDEKENFTEFIGRQIPLVGVSETANLTNPKEAAAALSTGDEPITHEDLESGIFVSSGMPYSISRLTKYIKALDRKDAAYIEKKRRAEFAQQLLKANESASVEDSKYPQASAFLLSRHQGARAANNKKVSEHEGTAVVQIGSKNEAAGRSWNRGDRMIMKCEDSIDRQFEWTENWLGIDEVLIGEKNNLPIRHVPRGG